VFHAGSARPIVSLCSAFRQSSRSGTATSARRTFQASGHGTSDANLPNQATTAGLRRLDRQQRCGRVGCARGPIVCRSRGRCLRHETAARRSRVLEQRTFDPDSQDHGGASRQVCHTQKTLAGGARDEETNYLASRVARHAAGCDGRGVVAIAITFCCRDVPLIVM
jgi:hypothetical protein